MQIMAELVGVEWKVSMPNKLPGDLMMMSPTSECPSCQLRMRQEKNGEGNYGHRVV